MNPMNWSREHQIALLLAVLIGITHRSISSPIAAAPATVSTIPSGCSYRADRSDPTGVHWWALTGGLVGVGITFFRRLTR